MAINTEELKLLIENIIPNNIKDNHIFFKRIFDVFFDYLSDTYKLGSDSHLLLETDRALWNSDYSSLNNVDLTEIKRELIKTYLHDYNIFFDKLENDDEIHKYINTLFKELNIDRTFDTSTLTDCINEEEFLIHKKFAQQKTIPILFNYIEDLIIKTGVGQFSDEETHFKMYEGTNYNPRRAFAYTVDTSLFKPIYMGAIKPITHPLGFSFNYYKQIDITQTDYFNIDTAIDDFKVYVMQGDLEINAYMPPVNKMPKDCSFNPKNNVPQFIVPAINTLSDYGSKKTTIAGNTFIRTSDNKYKLISDGIEQFEGDIVNCTLLDWNIDDNSYGLHQSEDTDQDIRRDLYGCMVNYNDISTTFVDLTSFPFIDTLGDTIGEILVNTDDVEGKVYHDVALDAFYDVKNKAVWLKKWDDVVGDFYWDRSRYLGMNRDFITFKSNESMYSLEALQFSNFDDSLRIYSVDQDRVLNPYGGCISFFITLLDIDDLHYVVTAKKSTSTSITHSIMIEPDGVFITEVNGINSKGYFDFEPNRRYHIVFNWDDSGRNIYVDGVQLFLQDDNKTYNEKFYIENVNKELYTIDDYLSIDIPFTRKSLKYQELNTYLDLITLDLKVDYKKGSTVLFENLSDTSINGIRTMMDDSIASIQREIVDVQNQLLRITTLSKDSMYIMSETMRVDKLVKQAQDYIKNISNFDIKVGDLTINFQDLIVEVDEGSIKNMFDSIDDVSVPYEYMIPTSNAGFQYNTETNELYLGTPLYYAEQYISKANYILDNFDIINRPLTLDEMLEIKKDHDSYVKGDIFASKGLELYFSLDRKIFEHYHNEMETVDNCFTPWYIGDDYSFGMDNNLLLMYYNNMANCGLIYSADDCKFGQYLDHPKSKVDSALEYGVGTIVYANVLNVSEMEENGRPKLIAYLDNDTRIEYVRGVYWRHYNNSNGTIIEEKSKNTIMDYSYQIRVIGSKTNDGTRIEFDGDKNVYIDYDKTKEYFKLDTQLGESTATLAERLVLSNDLVKDKKYRRQYMTESQYNSMVEVLKTNSYLLVDDNGIVVKVDRSNIDICSKNPLLENLMTYWEEMVKDEELNVYSRLDGYFDSLVYKWDEMSFNKNEELKFSLNSTINDYFYKEPIYISEEDILNDNGLISAFMTDGFGFKLYQNDNEVASIDIDNDVVTYIPYSAKLEDFFNSTGTEYPSESFVTFDYPTLDMKYIQSDYYSIGSSHTVNWFPTVGGVTVEQNLVSIPTPESCDSTDTEKVFVQSDYWSKDKVDTTIETIKTPIVSNLSGTPTTENITIQY